jgi:cytoskeletal protein CcmA (bactofilin family)
MQNAQKKPRLLTKSNNSSYIDRKSTSKNQLQTMATIGREKPAPDASKNISGIPASTPGSGNTCVISKDTMIEGNFACEQDVRLDGVIKGDVRCTKRLVIGETGRIEGKVTAESAVIQGTIKGEVTIQDVLQLKSTALVDGVLQAKALLVEEGGRYLGECRVGSKG